MPTSSSKARSKSRLRSKKYAWHQLVRVLGVPPRSRHGHKSVAIGRKMIVFPGSNDELVNEMKYFQADTNKWYSIKMKGDIPPPSVAYGLTTDGVNRVFMHGGFNGKSFSFDLYLFKTTNWKWKKLECLNSNIRHKPKPRMGHSIAFFQNKIYGFGGMINCYKKRKKLIPHYLNDLYILELKRGGYQISVPVTHGPRPEPRESHTSLFYKPQNSNRFKLIIYGGTNCDERFDDLWVLDIKTMTWNEILTTGSVPDGRSLHTATLLNQKMYVFGGWIGCWDKFDQPMFKLSNTLAVLNLATMHWEYNSGEQNDFNKAPRPRAAHSAVAIDSRIYIWSGRNDQEHMIGVKKDLCHSDLWLLETEKPGHPGIIKLNRVGTKTLDLSWDYVPNAVFYRVDISKCSKQDPIAEKFRTASDVPMVIFPPRPGFPADDEDDSDEDEITDTAPSNIISEPDSAAKNLITELISTTSISTPTKRVWFSMPCEENSTKVTASIDYEMSGISTLAEVASTMMKLPVPPVTTTTESLAVTSEIIEQKFFDTSTSLLSTESIVTTFSQINLITSSQTSTVENYSEELEDMSNLSQFDAMSLLAEIASRKPKLAIPNITTSSEYSFNTTTTEMSNITVTSSNTDFVVPKTEWSSITVASSSNTGFFAPKTEWSNIAVTSSTTGFFAPKTEWSNITVTSSNTRFVAPKIQVSRVTKLSSFDANLLKSNLIPETGSTIPRYRFIIPKTSATTGTTATTSPLVRLVTSSFLQPGINRLLVRTTGGTNTTGNLQQVSPYITIVKSADGTSKVTELGNFNVKTQAEQATIVRNPSENPTQLATTTVMTTMSNVSTISSSTPIYKIIKTNINVTTAAAATTHTIPSTYSNLSTQNITVSAVSTLTKTSPSNIKMIVIPNSESLTPSTMIVCNSSTLQTSSTTFNVADSTARFVPSSSNQRVVLTSGNKYIIRNVSNQPIQGASSSPKFIIPASQLTGSNPIRLTINNQKLVLLKPGQTLNTTNSSTPMAITTTAIRQNIITMTPPKISTANVSSGNIQMRVITTQTPTIATAASIPSVSSGNIQVKVITTQTPTIVTTASIPPVSSGNIQFALKTTQTPTIATTASIPSIISGNIQMRVITTQTPTIVTTASIPSVSSGNIQFALKTTQTPTIVSTASIPSIASGNIPVKVITQTPTIVTTASISSVVTSTNVVTTVSDTLKISQAGCPGDHNNDKSNVDKIESQSEKALESSPSVIQRATTTVTSTTTSSTLKVGESSQMKPSTPRVINLSSSAYQYFIRNVVNPLIQSQPIQSQPIQSQPIQSKPIQSQPIQSQPIQSQPIQSQPIQSPPFKIIIPASQLGSDSIRIIPADNNNKPNISILKPVTLTATSSTSATSFGSRMLAIQPMRSSLVTVSPGNVQTTVTTTAVPQFVVKKLAPIKTSTANVLSGNSQMTVKAIDIHTNVHTITPTSNVTTTANTTTIVTPPSISSDIQIVLKTETRTVVTPTNVVTLPLPITQTPTIVTTASISSVVTSTDVVTTTASDTFKFPQTDGPGDDIAEDLDNDKINVEKIQTQSEKTLESLPLVIQRATTTVVPSTTASTSIVEESSESKDTTAVEIKTTDNVDTIAPEKIPQEESSPSVIQKATTTVTPSTTESTSIVDESSELKDATPAEIKTTDTIDTNASEKIAPSVTPSTTASTSIVDDSSELKDTTPVEIRTTDTIVPENIPQESAISVIQKTTTIVTASTSAAEDSSESKDTTPVEIKTTDDVDTIAPEKISQEESTLSVIQRASTTVTSAATASTSIDDDSSKLKDATPVEIKTTDTIDTIASSVTSVTTASTSIVEESSESKDTTPVGIKTTDDVNTIAPDNIPQEESTLSVIQRTTTTVTSTTTASTSIDDDSSELKDATPVEIKTTDTIDTIALEKIAPTVTSFTTESTSIVDDSSELKDNTAVEIKTTDNNDTIAPEKISPSVTSVTTTSTSIVVKSSESENSTSVQIKHADTIAPSKKISPKKITPKKISPKKISPKKIPPKKIPPKKILPKKSLNQKASLSKSKIKPRDQERWFYAGLFNTNRCLVKAFYIPHPGHAKDFVPTPTHSCKMDLQPGIKYKVRVMPINPLGIGPWSEPKIVRTILPIVPMAPKCLGVFKTKQGDARISWKPKGKVRAKKFFVFLAVKSSIIKRRLMRRAERRLKRRLRSAFECYVKLSLKRRLKRLSRADSKPSLRSIFHQDVHNLRYMKFVRRLRLFYFRRRQRLRKARLRSFYYIPVYQGTNKKCLIKRKTLKTAFLDCKCSKKPAINIRIVASNNVGFSPITQVKWFDQDRGKPKSKLIKTKSRGRKSIKSKKRKSIKPKPRKIIINKPSWGSIINKGFI